MNSVALAVTFSFAFKNPFHYNLQKLLQIAFLMRIAPLKIKQWKRNLFGLCFFTFCCGAFLAMVANIPYRPTILVKESLWYLLFPFLVFLCFYSGILKKQILTQPYSWKKRLKYGVYTITLGALLVIIIYYYLALAGAYFAKQSFSQRATVLRVDCHYSRRRNSSFNLRLLDERRRVFTLEFSYEFCRKYKDVSWLNGQSIELIGRHWALGEVYDNFYYEKKRNDNA